MPTQTSFVSLKTIEGLCKDYTKDKDLPAKLEAFLPLVNERKLDLGYTATFQVTLHSFRSLLLYRKDFLPTVHVCFRKACSPLSQPPRRLTSLSSSEKPSLRLRRVQRPPFTASLSRLPIGNKSLTSSRVRQRNSQALPWTAAMRRLLLHWRYASY